MSEVIAAKISLIRNMFTEAKVFAEAQEQPQVLADQLANTGKEYAAMVCEGFAMAMALKDIEKLSQWKAFLQSVNKQNELQLYVGLGWALAQESKSPFAYLPLFPPLMRYRVMDGFGYYDGTCRSRHSIRGQKVPEGLTGAALSAYTQGLGRSVWYLNSGDATKIAAMIATFPAERQTDLWRGVGSAATFVGGSDAAMLDALRASAAQFQPQLATGAALAVRTRMHLDALTADAKAACKAFCRQSPEEAVQLTENALPAATDENAYEQWITAMDKQYASTEVMH